MQILDLHVPWQQKIILFLQQIILFSSSCRRHQKTTFISLVNIRTECQYAQFQPSFTNSQPKQLSSNAKNNSKSWRVSDQQTELEKAGGWLCPVQDRDRTRAVRGIFHLSKNKK